MTLLVAQKFMSDLFTVSYCVSTSNHYRCHWERNQILSVCVGPNNWSVWVQSFGQMCSSPSPSAQLLVISSAFFLPCWDTLFCVTDANHRFVYLFISLPTLFYLFILWHRPSEWGCRFMIHGWCCCCTCAGVDQGESDCERGRDAVTVHRDVFVLVCD